MLKNIFNVSIVMMSIFATDVFASNDECKTEVNVAGTIETTNVSQTIQVGTIRLILSDDKDKVVFDKKGGIIGRITSQSQDETTGLPKSTLDHHIIFTDGSRIETNGDIAELKWPPIAFDANGEPCAFNVTETVSDIWGTKTFKRASGTITATGTISFCEGANGNRFILDGKVCLK